MKLVQTQNHLLLIDEEAEIKYNAIIFESDICLINVVGKGYVHNKTDFKIIAYYPLNSEAKELDRLLLLPNPFKNKKECYNKDAIIEAFYTNSREWKNRLQDYIDIDFESWFEEKIKGNKEYIETKQFSLEDMIAFGKKCFYKGFDKSENDDANCFTAWREENYSLVQSLSTQQLPKEFIPEYETITVDNSSDFLSPLSPSEFSQTTYQKLKTITNSEGKEVLVGTYKY